MELEDRMNKLRELETSIADYENGKAITLSKALIILGAIDETSF